MDIQGAEYLALDGLSETLDERLPELFVEVHPDLLPEFGHTAEELIEYLESKGYRLEYQVGDGWTSTPASRFRKTAATSSTRPDRGERVGRSRGCSDRDGDTRESTRSEFARSRR
jgi:hypothetical protein